MPRTQDFTNSTIYHIRNIETKNVIYVGSTTNFPQRKRQHKHRYNDTNSVKSNIPLYTFMRDNGGFDCFEIVPKSHLSLNNKIELIIAEQEEIDKHSNLLNCKKSYQNDDERKLYKKEYMKEYNPVYSKEHKENKKMYDKIYNQINYDKIREKKKQYSQQIVVCECGCKISQGNLSHHRKTKKHQVRMVTLSSSMGFK